MTTRHAQLAAQQSASPHLAAAPAAPGSLASAAPPWPPGQPSHARVSHAHFPGPRWPSCPRKATRRAAENQGDVQVPAAAELLPQLPLPSYVLVLPHWKFTKGIDLS